MANDRRDTLETLLKFTVDRPALSLAQQGVEAIKRELTKLGPSAELGVRGVRSGFRVLGRDVDKAKRDVASLKSELQELGRASVKPEIDTSGLARAQGEFEAASRRVALAGDVQSNLGALRGLAGTAGATGLAGGIGVAGEVIVLAEELPRLKTALAGLPDTVKAAVQAIGAGNVGMIGAIAALTAVILYLRSEAEKTKASADIAIGAVADYNELILQGTTESLTAGRKAAEEQLALARRNFEDSQRLYTGLQEGTRQAFGDVGLAITEFNSRIGTGAGELTAAREAYEANEKALKEAEAAVGVYNRALESSEVAANDAAAAAEKAAEAQRELNREQIALLDQQIQRELEAQRLIREGSTQSVQARIQANLDEINANNSVIQALTTLAATSEDAAARLAQLNDRNQQLLASNESLISQVQPLVTAREQESEAAQRVLGFFQGIPKALAEAGSQALETARAVAEYGRVARESAQRLTEINTDYQRAVGEAARQREQALADAQREAGEARNEAIRDAQQEREDAEREHQQNIARIQRDFQRSSQQAIADRNVVAYTQAEQTRKDALADENQNYANRRRDINRSLQETLRDINARLNQQRETIARQYNDQLRTAAEAANRARQIEYQKAQQELQIRQQSMQQQVQIVQQGTQAMGQAFANLFRSANTALNQRASLPAAAGTSLGSIVGGLIPRFANEGYITRSGLAYVDRGEVVMKASRLENTVNNSFTVNATSSRKIRQQVDRYLERELSRVGL